MGYHPRTNRVKDEKGDLVTDSHSVLASWRNHFSQQLVVQDKGLVMLGRQKCTAESLVPEPSTSEFEMAIEKLKRHKSPGIDQIPAELIKTGGRTVRSEIQKHRSIDINSIWKKEELPEEWKDLIIVPIYTKGDNTDSNNYRDI